jgi:hypothetical protein
MDYKDLMGCHDLWFHNPKGRIVGNTKRHYDRNLTGVDWRKRSSSQLLISRL